MVFDTLKPSIWLLLFTAVLASDFANPFLNFGSETELNNLHHLELSDIKANLGKTIAARSDLGSRQLQCKDPGYGWFLLSDPVRTREANVNSSTVPLTSWLLSGRR